MRAQGAWISDKEVEAVVKYWKEQGEPDYQEDIVEQAPELGLREDEEDELLEDAIRLVVENGQASISMLQRRFRIGYSRAARLIDIMEVQGAYLLPPTSLLRKSGGRSRRGAELQQDLLEETLANFGIEAKVVNVSQGPVITRYELQPAPGIKVSRITSLADDLALALAAEDVRIEAPVPGKPVVGIEVPNKERELVLLRDVLESREFAEHPSPVALALGKDIAGQPVIADLKKWLHVLIAGATGSGKSVCLNCVITSLLFRTTPDTVKLLMIDPKRVELSAYDGIPHLISPVVTDPKKAAIALRWAVGEMERRYELFAEVGVRNIEMYHEWYKEGSPEEEREHLPYVVVIVDELADLMMVAAAEVEDAICRLAQMARAAGMYLIIATQRPSVDVITGPVSYTHLSGCTCSLRGPPGRGRVSA